MTGLEYVLPVATSHPVVFVLLFNLYSVCVKLCSHVVGRSAGRQVGTSLLMPTFFYIC